MSRCLKNLVFDFIYEAACGKPKLVVLGQPSSDTERLPATLNIIPRQIDFLQLIDRDRSLLPVDAVNF